MRLKFRCGMGGHTPDGTTFNVFPGDEVEWEDEEEARRLVKERIATPVKASDVETATVPRSAPKK